MGSEYVWLDAPFFKFIERFAQIQSYFAGVTWSIAKVVTILCLGFMFLRYAMTGEGLREGLTKFLLAFVIYSIVIANYPRIITGINDLIYSFSVESTYLSVGEDVKSLQEYAEAVRREMDMAIEEAQEAVDGETDRSSYGLARRSKVQHLVKLKKERAEMGEGFDLSALIMDDLFDEKTKYIRPNGMINLIFMVSGEIWNNTGGEGRGITQVIMDALCIIAVILCGIFGSVQYFIGALEFSLVTAVGVIFLPFMLWDGTKFITEKFIGALLGFFLKMLFLTICLLFMYYGFLEMALQSYENGRLQQIIYFIFSAIFYMMITQNGPKLAVTLLTGTPQMSLMEVAQAAGAYGGAALAGKKIAGAVGGRAVRGVTKTGFALANVHARAKGAADFAAGEGATKKGRAAAYGSSIGSSVKEGVMTRVSNVGRSLLSGGGRGGGGGHGGGGSGGGGGTRGYNRFSQRERFNQPNEKGQNLTIGEHLKNQYNRGQGDGLNHMIKKEEQAQRMNPPIQGRSLGGASEPSGGGNSGGGQQGGEKKTEK